MALTSCATPAAGRPTFDIGPDEMEVGVGIHGEPGQRREKMRPAAEIVTEMSEAILIDLEPPDGSEVLAFVNGLGGTPLLELYLVQRRLERLPERERLIVERRFGLQGERQTLETVGRELGLTRERVRQLEVRALKQLETELADLAPVQTAAAGAAQAREAERVSA